MGVADQAGSVLIHLKLVQVHEVNFIFIGVCSRHRKLASLVYVARRFDLSKLMLCPIGFRRRDTPDS